MAVGAMAERGADGWLVVGAGFTGATAARRLAEATGEHVLVVDRRDHSGGNAHDGPNAAGVTIHHYGPHIFHTNSERVFAFLSRFTRWRPYAHHVRAEVEGRLVPLPFGLPAIDMLFPAAKAAALTDKLVAHYGMEARVPILKLREATDAALRELADYVHAHVFEGYSRKQWAMGVEALLPSVTARVPVVVSRDERYFTDRYQSMPADGYAALFDRLLDHPAIELALSTPYESLPEAVKARRTIYTGPLDAFFGFCEGELPYRSLDFVEETRPGFPLQPCAVLNYPRAHAYTRVTEQGWLTGQQGGLTTLVREYPRAHVPGVTEPFYPIPTREADALAARYRALAGGLAGRVWFAGRLADYLYYNMDQACARALTLVEKEILPALRRS